MKNTTWNEYWSALRIGECVQQGNMQVFALRHALKPALDYLTLEQALKVGGGRKLRIEEVSSEGSVNDLKVVNELNSPVLLVEGEILLGAKQNRTVHTTILVDENSEITIPVACIESGRWSPFFKGGFSLSDQYAHASMRYSKLKHVASVRAAAGPAAAGHREAAYSMNQGEVWDNVSEFSVQGQAHSDTSNAEEVYRKFKDRAAFWHNFACPDESAGIAVALDGRLIGVECFDRPAALQKMFPRMIQCYVSEAMMRESEREPGKSAGAPVTGEQIESFLREVAGSKVDSAPGVGLGEDLRARAAGWSAALLTCRGGSLHAQVLLAREEPSGDQEPTGSGNPPAGGVPPGRAV